MDTQENLILDNIVKRVNDNTRRIRKVEEEVFNIQEQVKYFETNFLEQKKVSNESEEETKKELIAMRDKLANMEIDIQKFMREIKTLATKREIKEFQNYIDLIAPVTTKFVTKKEVEEIINEKISQ